MNYVTPIIFKDKKIWALGNQLYSSPELNQTFHDFVQIALRDTLGSDWFSKQKLLSEDDRHHIFKCFSHADQWKKELIKIVEPSKDGIFAYPPNGWVKSMLTLAFDIATLRNCSNLPDSLIKRLRIPRQYQGARYEIMVAAIIARLGFTIKWIDDNTEKHSEFIAIHTETGTEIAVEAKSRHRAGVLHTPGKVDNLKNRKGDIQRLFNQALKKTECGKMPFIIFIDVNAPQEDFEDFKQKTWIKDILNTAKKQEPNTPENPSTYNAVYFTNFSFHYQTDKDAGNAETLQALPLFPLFQVPQEALYSVILNALHNYGYIPDINIED